MRDSVFDRVLDRWGGEVVLMDVGAAGAPPAAWLPLAKHSHYVALDPDTREMGHVAGVDVESGTGGGGPFKRTSVVHEAVTPDGRSSAVHFYLTRFPFCSSTLRPDPAVVANFFNADRFEILREVNAHAVTLAAVLARLNLDRIAWLKLDTQGTDRRIYESLAEPVRRRLLAVDLEPGLRGAYAGEDLFGDVHAALVRDGFWLSDMRVRGMVRMRQSTLEELHARHGDIDRGYVQRALKHTPGWAELRYLRSIETLDASPSDDDAGARRRDLALLWAIATIDGQHGFALDVAAHWEQRFGADETAAMMRDESVARIRAAHALMPRTLWRRWHFRARELVHRYLPRSRQAGTVAKTPQIATHQSAPATCQKFFPPATSDKP
jgi:hypothetical protein